MDRVVMEIAETEAVYVRDLQQIIEGYLHRWRSSEDCPIGSKQLKDLFGNIEDIFLFNSEFLCELEQCGLDPVKVAKTFVKNNNGFSIYTDYCTNYPRTVSLLTELMRRELTVRLFRERQSFLQHSLPLGSYLLKPVQRILKYHLLLQNIVKHFGKESEGYRDIADALSAMTGIAHHINEMKRKHEHAIRVQEIQSLLYGWEGEDLTTYGELCAEGAFRMYGAKAMRHAFLFDRMLLLTKRKEEGILMYKAHIMCSNLMLIESVPGEPLSFHVIPFDNPRLQYTLQARNLEQKREWALQLKRVILENYNAVIPTHARQLVMELGQNRTDDEILAEKSTPKRQHSAPEYLERRKQERRKSETGLLLRHRLRRSNRKDSSGGACVVTDGLSSKEPSPSVQRRGGRRAQSVSRDRNDSVSSCGQEGEAVQRGGAATLPFGATAEKVKDRFGSWRRKSEPSYLSSKGGTSVGHLSIYVSPDFIERSSDSLALGTCSSSRKDEAEKEEVISVASNDPEQEKRKADAAVSSSEGGAQVGSAGADHLPQSDVIAQEDEEGVEACSRRESLEEIVGQLLMQSHHFQRMLSTRQRRRAQHGTAKSRQHAREEEEEEEGDCGDNKGTQCALPPPPLPPQQDPPPTSSNKFRAQREAHMRALREQQRRMSVISISNGVVQEAGPNKDPPSFFSPSAVSCRGDDCVAESPLNGGHEQGDDANHYDNLLDVWARVHQEGPTPGIVVDPKGGSWRPPEEGDNSPTAEWLKQQDLSHTNSPLKAGSLPRGFSLLSTQHQRPPPHASTFASTSPGGSACDHPPPFRMDRPFSIASESPARADEIDFEDIEQYMAETGLGVSSFLSPRFPLSPLIADHHQDNDSIVASADDGRVQGADQDEDDEDDEDDVTSVAQINVHPDYRIYRPSVSRTALRHVISSVSNKLANLRLNASSGGITTEDDDEDGLGGVGEGGNARRRKRNSSSSRAVRGSCPNSLNSTFGLVSGDSESESVKGGAGGSSWLVKTLARHYSRGLKDRIRSIMTMNNAAAVGASSSHLNLEPDNDQSAKGEDVPSPCERSPSQDQSNASPPATKTTPYHKQGSSGLGARIAHGSEVPEYATPHVCGIGKGKAKEEEDVCSRPDSLLSATSSAFTSSSDGDNRTLSGAGTTHAAQESKAMPIRCNVLISAEDDDDEDDDDEYAVGSGDSYYERSFEAIESMITMDANVGSAEATGNVFRDSAIFSDHEEADTIAARLSGSPPKTTYNCSLARLPMPTAVSRSAASLSSKIPPPVPAKPRASNVAATASAVACAPRVSCGASGSRVRPQAAPPTAQLSVGSVKSVHQRRRELEMRGNYGNSYSSVDVAQCGLEGGRGGISSEEVVDDSAMPKGWVRHVVGKLQNGD